MINNNSNLEIYDYKEAVYDDVLDYIKENIDLDDYGYDKYHTWDELKSKLNEVCWDCDSITGNCSGSYTFSIDEAERYLYGNFDLIKKAANELGGNITEWLEIPEICDINIRCYLLSDAIEEAVDTIEERVEAEREADLINNSMDIIQSEIKTTNHINNSNLEIYDYKEAMYDDIKDYIERNIDLDDYGYDKDNSWDDLKEELNNDSCVYNGITGNSSGSYTFNGSTAQKYLYGNLNLISEASQSFGQDASEWLERGPEYCDVCIRCYLLPEVIDEVVDDIEEEIESERENSSLDDLIQTAQSEVKDTITTNKDDLER